MVHSHALTIARSAAQKNEQNLIKFVWLDIPAIMNDFIEYWKTTDKEPEEMHQACSKLHMLALFTLFTDDVV